MESLFGSNFHQRHRAHANSESVDSQYSRAMAKASVFSGLAVGGLSLVAGKRISPSIRRNLLVGSAVGLGIGIGMAKKQDPTVNIISNLVAGTAGLVAFERMRKYSPKGLQSFKQFLVNHGAEAQVNSVMSAVSHAKAKFPLLEHVISAESAAAGGALITMPVAHSIMTRVMAKMNRAATDHGDGSFIPSFAPNQAGGNIPRKSNDTRHRLNEHMSADVHFSGTHNSYYNKHQALEGL